MYLIGKTNKDKNNTTFVDVYYHDNKWKSFEFADALLMIDSVLFSAHPHNDTWDHSGTAVNSS